MKNRILNLIDSVETLVNKAVSSRKFVAAAGAFVAALANHNTAAAVAVVLAYVGVEGYVDSKSA